MEVEIELKEATVEGTASAPKSGDEGVAVDNPWIKAPPAWKVDEEVASGDETAAGDDVDTGMLDDDVVMTELSLSMELVA
jgi:hypothetical protein